MGLLEDKLGRDKIHSRSLNEENGIKKESQGSWKKFPVKAHLLPPH